MKKLLGTLSLMILIAGTIQDVTAQNNRKAQMASKSQKDNVPMVGGAPMYPNKDIIDNAVNSKDHTTLVTAVKAADLVATLKSAGPFTVFAPVNAAFDKLPEGTVATLLKPENKTMLTNVLTYHVVSGRFTSQDLARLIKEQSGRAQLKTVQGAALFASMKGSSIVLTDENGNVSTVTQADVMQSNGVIHVVDTVVLPGS